MKIQVKRIENKDTQADYPAPDTPDSPPFIIREKDNSQTYTPDQVADDLLKNLINFLNIHPKPEVIFEEDTVDGKPKEDIQAHPNTPDRSFPEEDLVDLITDESWLTLDTVEETPAPEDIFPVMHEDFRDFSLLI